MKPGRLEMLPRLFEEAQRLGRNGRAASRHVPVDVEHPKPDPFHMEGGNCPDERFALLDDKGGHRMRLGLEQVHELHNPAGSRLPLIDGHVQQVTPSVLPPAVQRCNSGTPVRPAAAHEDGDRRAHGPAAEMHDDDDDQEVEGLCQTARPTKNGPSRSRYNEVC